MKKAKVIKNGNSQAVRLPKECRFEGKEVVAKKVGSSVILSPVEDSWSAMFEALDQFEGDLFANGREQPEMEDRETF